MSKDLDKITHFLYEIGTMRGLMRAHYQTLLTHDASDNIASHSYRVAMIGWFLAKQEDADPYKVVMMCLLHDTGEARTGDQNWVHKRYVKTFDDEVIDEQFGGLPDELLELSKEFKERKTKEAQIAKDADLLDEVLLLREYEHQGNKEAAHWLYNDKGCQQIKGLHLETSKDLGKRMFEIGPSEWWKGLWTESRRK